MIVVITEVDSFLNKWMPTSWEVRKGIPPRTNLRGNIVFSEGVPQAQDAEYRPLDAIVGQ